MLPRSLSAALNRLASKAGSLPVPSFAITIPYQNDATKVEATTSLGVKVKTPLRTYPPKRTGVVADQNIDLNTVTAFHPSTCTP